MQQCKIECRLNVAASSNCAVTVCTEVINVSATGQQVGQTDCRTL